VNLFPGAAIPAASRHSFIVARSTAPCRFLPSPLLAQIELRPSPSFVRFLPAVPFKGSLRFPPFPLLDGRNSSGGGCIRYFYLLLPSLPSRVPTMEDRSCHTVFLACIFSPDPQLFSSPPLILHPPPCARIVQHLRLNGKPATTASLSPLLALLLIFFLHQTRILRSSEP